MCVFASRSHSFSLLSAREPCFFSSASTPPALSPDGPVRCSVPNPWQDARGPDGLYKGADALVIDAGANNEEEIYSKSKALQTWLCGYELTETVFILCSRSVHVLTGKKKVSYLEPMKTAENAVLPLELHIRDKTDKDAANYAALVAALKSSHAGATVATLQKEKPLGDFATGWRAALGESGLAVVELGTGLAELLAPKDDKEVGFIKRAGIFSAMVMHKHLVQKIEDVVEKDKKVTHEALAQGAEDAFAEPLKLGVKLPAELLEPAYTPIIQSGGEFDLKPSASSNSTNLFQGTITASLGARYKSYCANVGRTYVINPGKTQEKHYKLLLEVQGEAISALRVGAPLSAAYEAASNRLKSKAPHLEKKLTKNVGFAMGIEFREGTLVLNGKNESKVRPGMAFNVAVGIENIEDKDATDKRGQVYSLFVADTVVVKEEGPPDVHTDKAPKQWTEVSYHIGDDDDDGPGAGVKVNTGRRGEVEVLESRTRGAGKTAAATLENSAELANHQSELEERLRQEALDRVKSGGGGGGGPSGPVETAVAYKSADLIPNTAPQGGGALKTNQTVVDGRAETLLVPIFGRLVPFHISVVKNVTKSEEGGWTYLRINFVAPTAAGGMTGMPPEAKAEDHYVRELTLKARIPTNLNNTFRLIKELRKRVMAKERQEALEADLVTQIPLQVIKAGKIARLRDCYVRPNVGKKAPGVLEIHANGLRFMASRGEKLDLIFKNIKIAFFQPAEKEIIVLLHFHLRDPIMIGKKKTKDVQFYVEIMEASYALDAARRNGYDPDELEQEQQERRYRQRMNQEFQAFSKKIEEQAGSSEREAIDFDIPFRDLGFYGVPPHNRSTCFVMPCVNALVELTEPPWFVVPLDDIEVAHFERVVYGLKNFDLVLVMKDFSIKPVQVSAINVEHLDSLKTWLDSCNIKFYEGPANLNWGQIMKHITGMGLEEFYEEGGWKNVLSLENDSDEEGEEGESDESEYAGSGSDGSESEDEDDSDEYEVDSEDDSEDEGEESLDSDESEGKDFDQLEEEAKNQDKTRGRYEEDDKPKSKGKKRSQDYSASESEDDDKPKKKKDKGASSSKSASKGASKGSSSAKPVKKR